MIGLPDGWRRALSSRNKPYYYNATMDQPESQWECPEFAHENAWLNGEVDAIHTESTNIHIVTTWEETLLVVWGRRTNMLLRGHVSLYEHRLRAWNTLCYMFHHISLGVYVLVLDGKLRAFVPFVNNNYTNTWTSHLRFPNSTLTDFFLDCAERSGDCRHLQTVDRWVRDGTTLYSSIWHRKHEFKLNTSIT